MTKILYISQLSCDDTFSKEIMIPLLNQFYVGESYDDKTVGVNDVTTAIFDDASSLDLTVLDKVKATFAGIKTMELVNEKFYSLLWILSNWYDLSELDSAFTKLVESELASPEFADYREVILAAMDVDGTFILGGEEWEIKDKSHDDDVEAKLFEIFNYKA